MERRSGFKRVATREDAARRLQLDPMEQRILLNADVLALDLATTFSDQRDRDLLVRLYTETQQAAEGETQVRQVQILDASNHRILAFGDLSEISAISIGGSAGANNLIFDARSFGPDSTISLSFDGRGGTDRLTFLTDRDVNWTIDAANAGTATDGFATVDFSRVEWLEGDAGNQDEFHVTATGRLSGGIDGGAGGFDTLVLGEGTFKSVRYNTIDEHSGVIWRNANALHFTGLEPIIDNTVTANRTIEISTSVSTPTTAILTTGTTLDFLLSGPAFESLEFRAPTSSLTILSSASTAHVSLTIAGFSQNFSGNLTVRTENISVASGVQIGTAAARVGNVTLAAADASNLGSIGLSAMLGIVEVQSAVQVAGSIFATGVVTLTAAASRVGDVVGAIAAPGTLVSPLQLPRLTALAALSGTAVIDAAAFLLEAATHLQIDIDASDSAFGGEMQTVFARNSTQALIASGATVRVGTSTAPGESASAVVRATDTTDIRVDLTTNDAALTAGLATAGRLLDDYGMSFGVIDVTRNTQALVQGAVFGRVGSGALAVEALNDGVIVNRVNSGLVGVTYINATDDVRALVTGSTVQGASLSLLAENASRYESAAKVAINTVSGETTARLWGGSASVGALSVKALDSTWLSATSSDFAAALDSFLGIDLGIAVAVNQMDKDVTAEITGTVVNATGAARVEAENEQVLLSSAEAMVLLYGLADLNTYRLGVGGAISSNEMLGSTVAAITGGAHVTAGGAIIVDAANAALMDSRTVATTTASGGDNLAVGVAVAFNLVGFDVDNIFLLGIDTLLGLGLGATERPSEARAHVTGAVLSAGGAIAVAAANRSLMNATVSNVTKSDALGGFTNDASGKAFAFIFASNKVSSRTTAEIVDGPSANAISAGGTVRVEATDESGIWANTKLLNSSVTTNDGGATQIDAALGILAPARFRTDGATVTNASGQTVNASQTISFGDRIGLAPGYEATGTGDGAAGTVYRFMGGSPTVLNLTQVDFTNRDFWQPVLETEIVPTGISLTDGGSVGVGGLAVRNEVGSHAVARIADVDVTAVGDIVVMAHQALTLEANSEVSVESSGGSSIDGEGDSIAVGGAIAVNTANASALAEIARGADVTSSAGKVTVDAQNTSEITADLSAMMVSAGNTTGVLLAFNTLGYAPTNLLFQALDALIGTDIGPKTPSDTTARIIDSDVAGQAGVEVTAVNKATLFASVNTDVSALSEAVEGASAETGQGILSSNMLAGAARAYIDDTDTTPSGHQVLSAAGAVTVRADDEVLLNSETRLATGAKRTNDAGIGFINSFAQTLLDSYQYTTKSGTKALNFGDKVYVASDYAGASAGKVFQYMGAGPTLVNLGSVNFDTAQALDFWKEVDETNVIPDAIGKMLVKGMGMKNGSAKAYSVVITRNEAEGGAIAFIDDYTVSGHTGVSVTAREAATLSALESSTVNAANSYGGIMATNELNSRAAAFITDSTVRAAAGDVTVQAFNLAVL
ncbi:MAG: LEPR-XLL domain-containing protein, partial [Gemmobacter sp.]|nr:LEPR-XLL domain-containing protein [Gemmobacter sp.]